MKLKQILFVGAGGTCFLGLLAIWWINAPPSTIHNDVLNIPPGTSAHRVAYGLEDTGQIRSARWFLWLSRLRGAASRLRAGVYEIREGQSTWHILSELVAGRTRKARVTIPEGFASWQIAEALEAAQICSARDFRQAVAEEFSEGFLYPETYLFEENTPASYVRDVMRQHFGKVWVSVLKEAQLSPTASRLRLSHGRLWTKNQVVTLASLIEREARHEGERALISAVFHNRLKKRMRLESDPTVQFSLGYWKDRVLFRDLEVDSPYNTYRHFGLPPGSICSPGKASLAAALSPAKTDYLYFVADEAGRHKFSSTYKEHLRVVRERNRQRRQRKISQPSK